MKNKKFISQVIKFGEINRNNIIFDKNMKIEISGNIEDMYINEHGIKVINSFNLESISFVNDQTEDADGK